MVLKLGLFSKVGLEIRVIMAIKIGRNIHGIQLEYMYGI